jgi:endonuclease/exonuclease/phosphatase family metal-dependent hydrolase
MRIQKLFLFAFCVWAMDLWAQDTIRYMHYNLLNYGNGENFCTSTNNNIDTKDQHLRTILGYVHPEILAVNEMKDDESITQRLLDNDLNINGVSYYRAAQMTNFANSTIVNAFYYDSRKMGLLAQDVVVTSLRDINIYKMYLKTNDLATEHDTIFFYPIVAHLKAGNTTEDANERAAEANQLMNYLTTAYQPGNFILNGDFNFYTSAEAAYQNLTNFSNAQFNFNDPIDSPGSWNNNGAFAQIHTQSTHSTTAGCAASGGLDDRFDFILVSNDVLAGTGRLKALPSTYQALGQDGQHFNLSINAPPQNPNAPQDLSEALYGCSDHLPVTLDFVCDKPLAVQDLAGDENIMVSYNNPCGSFIQLQVFVPTHAQLTYHLVGLQGQLLNSGTLGAIQGQGSFQLDLSAYKPGYYTLILEDGMHKRKSCKVIVIGK